MNSVSCTKRTPAGEQRAAARFAFWSAQGKAGRAQQHRVERGSQPRLACRAATHRRRRQLGQVLPLGLTLLVACLAAMLLMYSSARAVDEKLTVNNAADAAAYSAGIVQARALNYQAYVNRAIMANELAIAQSISLVSWLRYFETAVNNAAGIDAFIASRFLVPSGDLLQALQLMVVLSGSAYLNYLSGSALSEAVSILETISATGIVNAHAGSVIALRASQQATDAAMSVGALQRDIAREVARATDPSLDVELVPVVLPDIAGLTRTYGRGGGDDRGRLADLVMRSRDSFTADRGWQLDGPSIPFVQRNVALRKRGGTELINFDEWQARDTLAGHSTSFGCGKGIPRWCAPVEEPLACSGAALGSAGSGSHVGYCASGDSGSGEGSFGGSRSGNPFTTRVADGLAEDLSASGAFLWRGLSDTQELADLSAARQHRVPISFLVSKPQNSSRTAGRSANIAPTGTLALFDAGPIDGRMVALARAEVTFMRAEARGDGRTERPSLYSPYWRANLVAPTAADRAYAALRQNNLTLGP